MYGHRAVVFLTEFCDFAKFLDIGVDAGGVLQTAGSLFEAFFKNGLHPLKFFGVEFSVAVTGHARVAALEKVDTDRWKMNLGA